MKIYISGPIKGIDDFEDRFRRAEERCRAFDWEVVNPCTIEHAPDCSYEDYMRGDLRGMLDCDAIYLLRGWEYSAGARVEFLAAVACGMRVYYQVARSIELAM